MKKPGLIILSLLMVFMFSCRNGDKQGQSENLNKLGTDQRVNEESDDASTISLTELTDFPEYNDVSLALLEPKEPRVEASYKVSKFEQKFKFEVKGMELGEQTEGADDLGIANAEDGQHIHFIIDNKPYMAFYDDSFKYELAEGTHFIVAFPARSYHMSVKNKNAVVTKKLQVGDRITKKFDEVNLAEPMIIYSRPTGEYEGEDQTQKVLLDFYLLNTDLAPDGNKVKVTVNEEQEFTVDKWAPYILEGLPMGKNTVELQLIDKDGKEKEGAFTKVKQSFNLK